MTHLAMSPWMAKRKPTTFTGKKVKRGCKGACKSSKRMIANSYYKRQALAKFGMFDTCLDWNIISCQFTIFHLYHPVPTLQWPAWCELFLKQTDANGCALKSSSSSSLPWVVSSVPDLLRLHGYEFTQQFTACIAYGFIIFYHYIFICERVKVMENLGLLGNLPASTSSTAATQQQLLSLLLYGLQIGHPQVRWLP